ncbi:hypothetical protein CH274_03325 [Rhodococcus sp. 06-418-5]|nr:hypothetical protein CH274_03325 [Rhodococcus sp. 06-418-5]
MTRRRSARIAANELTPPDTFPDGTTVNNPIHLLRNTFDLESVGIRSGGRSDGRTLENRRRAVGCW